ncbi:MAG: hypothetical protein NTV55_01985 [Planctomycetota bacterium]|nr:hypothetical protein [Planctomycetota bacterium]
MVLGRGAMACTSLVWLVGCATGPLQDNPLPLGPAGVAPIQEANKEGNPLYLPVGPPSYGLVFDKSLDTLDDVFDIAYANRYDGRIETFPRVAPGLFQPWKHGNMNPRDRIHATCQSLRHRGVLTILAADDGGFFVDLKIYKELENLAAPARTTGAAAAFRSSTTVERNYDVIDPLVIDSGWIPLGRDTEFEQFLLRKLASSATRSE